MIETTPEDYMEMISMLAAESAHKDVMLAELRVKLRRMEARATENTRAE